MEYNPIEPHRPITGDHCVMCFALIGPLDVLGGGEEEEDELPYVDHDPSMTRAVIKRKQEPTGANKSLRVLKRILESQVGCLSIGIFY